MIARSSLAALAALGVMATVGATQHVPARPVTVIADRWLYCIECEDGERDSVVAAASRARDSTVSYLSARLLLGPPLALVRGQQRHLHLVYARDSAYALRDLSAPLTTSRAAFVDHYARSFDVGVRSRAAFALGVIGGSDARVALDSALALPLPPPVRSSVRFARDSVWHP